MTPSLRFTRPVLMALAFFSLSCLPAAAGCQTVGAIGTGINEGMAKFMADAGLKNVLEGKGLKPSGPIKHTCEAGAIVTECSARQQGCK